MAITSRLLNRTTIIAVVLAAGVTSAAAHQAAAQNSDVEQRSVLTIGVDSCPGSAAGAISVGYDDLVDGHRPVQVTERLSDQNGELWSSTELHHVDGDYFNVHNFPSTVAIPIADSSVFTYSVSIGYDDGVTQT